MSDKTPKVIVEEITFNDGKDITFAEDDIVVFVGPNNVGKSRSLKDIMEKIVDGTSKGIVVANVRLSHRNLSNENMLNYLEKNYKNSDNNYGQDYMVIVPPENTFSFNRNQLAQPGNPVNEQQYYKCFMTYLSTENRLNMTRPVRYGAGPYDQQGQNIMMRLLENSGPTAKLNKATEEIFETGVEVYGAGNRMSYKIGSGEVVKNAVGSKYKEAKEKIKSLEELYDQGDGIRSAVATLGAMVANDSSIILVDEPETFLHPPQAKALGCHIAKLSAKKQCFISTHSLDLLKGLLAESPSRIRVVRINRQENKNAFHIVDRSELEKIANDKSLKYTNILDGLFYSKVVLCENESDCKFYSAILDSISPDVAQNTLFCGVNGKDSFVKVAPILKTLGVDLSIIADFDLLNRPDTIEALLRSLHASESVNTEDFKDFLKILQKEAPEVTPKTCRELQKEIDNTLSQEDYLTKAISKKIKALIKTPSIFNDLKHQGVEAISGADCLAKFNSIEKALSSNNIFVVPTGEIESFIEGTFKHGEGWADAVFAKYPDLNDKVYDEAKKFIRKVFNIGE